MMDDSRFAVTVDLDKLVKDFESMTMTAEDDGISVAAIRALTTAIGSCKANTLMQMEIELKAAVEKLREQHPTSVELSAVCELFLRYVTRSVQEFTSSFDSVKQHLEKQGMKFGEKVAKSRELIADYGSSFIRDGATVLTHGYSQVVLNLLRKAALEDDKHFEVFVTEGRPVSKGYDMATALKNENIPVTLIMDSAAAHFMEKVDLVVVGAEGVVENGGLIGPIGTFSIAVAAHALNRPFYVAAESHKFARIYPLNQYDFPSAQIHTELRPIEGREVPDGVALLNPAHDYTPPSFITLLYTDLGVLTPAAVSDELIKLYI